MRAQSPLFQSHLDAAHEQWQKLIQPGDIAIDATCGNGHDTLLLAQLNCETVHAIDIQESAIQNTRQRLQTHLPKEKIDKVHFYLRCHSKFPEMIAAESVKLIVYNLGYLPGGNKENTTKATTTLQSIQEAQRLLVKGGAISITCYPGHAEGKREEEMILNYLSALNPCEWSSTQLRWINRHKGPSLLFLARCCCYSVQ